ncbi:hypothetical protein ACFL6D_04810 [Spirochaetota bacterium]
MQKRIISIALVLIVAAALTGCASYNDYVVTEEISPGDTVGVLTFESKFKLGKMKSLVAQGNMYDTFTMASIQAFARAGYDVKIVNLNFFELYYKYPMIPKIMAKNFSSSAKMKFNEFLDRSIERVSDFDRDVEIKKDLARIKEELGLKYLVIIIKRSGGKHIIPILPFFSWGVHKKYDVIGINLTSYTFSFLQSLKENDEWIVIRGIMGLINPFYEKQKTEKYLDQMIGLIKRKGRSN